MAIPSKVVEQIHARSGWACEKCGTNSSIRWSLHHRKPRGMGGTKNKMINSPANLLWLCGSGTEGCHGWIESHRTAGYEDGLLLHRNDDPTTIPVVLHYGTVLLDDEGGVQTC